MKPSQRLWTSIGKFIYIALVIFCIQQMRIMIDASEDFPVPVTVSSVYSQGYHGKYSVGEDFYVNCSNPTYGRMTIKVGYNTYASLDKGDRTTFILDKLDIDRYSRNDDDRLVSKYMVMYMMLSLFVLGFLCYLIIDRLIKGIKMFNKYLDRNETT